MQKNTEIVLKIKTALSTVAPKATVILYGSHARGDFNRNSDFDVLILLDKDTISRADDVAVKYPLYDIEFETGHIISPVVLSKSNWESRHRITPFYDNVIREGIVL